jgi:hypothetical protein
MNRGQLDRLILRVERMVSGNLKPCGASTVETDSSSRVSRTDSFGSIHGQVAPGFLDPVSRTQQLGVVEAPEPGQARSGVQMYTFSTRVSVEAMKAADGQRIVRLEHTGPLTPLQRLALEVISSASVHVR